MNEKAGAENEKRIGDGSAFWARNSPNTLKILMCVFDLEAQGNKSWSFLLHLRNHVHSVSDTLAMTKTQQAGFMHLDKLYCDALIIRDGAHGKIQSVKKTFEKYAEYAESRGNYEEALIYYEAILDHHFRKELTPFFFFFF